MSKLIPEWQRASVLEAVFDQLSDAILLYDKNMVITGINRLNSAGLYHSKTSKTRVRCW